MGASVMNPEKGVWLSDYKDAPHPLLPSVPIPLQLPPQRCGLFSHSLDLDWTCDLL